MVIISQYEKKLWYVDPSQAAVKKEVPESKSLKQIAEKQSPSPIVSTFNLSGNLTMIENVSAL